MTLVTLDQLPMFVAGLVAPSSSGMSARRRIGGVGTSAQLNPGDSVALVGPIGAGKTTLVRHLLMALGCKDFSGFASPTFTLLNRYEIAGIAVNHIDLYRLTSFAELEQADLLPCFSDDTSLTLVEWADRFPEALALCNKRLEFAYGADENSRHIEIA